MSKFDYTQYGSDTLSDGGRRLLAVTAKIFEYQWRQDPDENTDYLERDSICTALREIDRLRAEVERLTESRRQLIAANKTLQTELATYHQLPRPQSGGRFMNEIFD